MLCVLNVQAQGHVLQRSAHTSEASTVLKIWAWQCRFHGGEKPDLADLSVFGVIRSVTCTDTFMDLMHNTKISGWYEQMMKEVGDSARLSAS